MPGRLLRNGARVLAVGCAVGAIALGGAQSADAAFSYAETARGVTDCRGGEILSARGGGPCYFLAVEIWGAGEVTSIFPEPVPGATGTAQYPDGHIRCPQLGIWDCNYYFNWGLGEQTWVYLEASEPGFVEWVDCPYYDEESEPFQCRVQAEGQASYCVQAHYQGGAKPTPSPCDESPLPPEGFNLGVGKRGAGSGTVTRTAGGINCGTDCRERIAAPSNVTLTAVPDSGSTFGGWSVTCVMSGAETCSAPSCHGTGPCTWTVASATDYGVTATFNRFSSPPPPPPPNPFNTVLTKKPVKTTKSTTAVFSWRAKRTDGTFTGSFNAQCRIDRQRVWKTCGRSKTYKKLKPGAHTFRVRVGEANRWDPTPAVHTWKVKK